MDDPLASSPAAVVAVLRPGRGTSTLSVLDVGREVARFECNTGLAGITELIALAAGTLGIEAWHLDETGVGPGVANEVKVRTAARLGINFEPFRPEVLDTWGPALDLPSGWPDRFDLRLWRELWSWMRDVLRWRTA